MLDDHSIELLCGTPHVAFLLETFDFQQFTRFRNPTVEIGMCKIPNNSNQQPWEFLQ
jgi:hypothetical protein